MTGKKKHQNVINSQNSTDGSVVAWLHAASASGKTKYRKILGFFAITKKALNFLQQQELNTDSTPFIDTWPENAVEENC